MLEAPPPADGSVWPVPIRFIGVTGEIYSGKTIFAASIAPNPAECTIYDLEYSSEAYGGAGWNRVDVYGELKAKFPRGYKGPDLWKWWRDDVAKRVIANGSRVVVIDPASELEDSLEAELRQNPTLYGLSAAVINKSPMLMWARMKSILKDALIQGGSKVETCVFVVHMKSDFKDNMKRKPKGKVTLMELATVFLELKRTQVIDGKRVAVPSAKVIKSRLSVWHNGVPVPVLPDFIPRCTPGAIRYYMANPVGLRDLRDDEKIQVETMSEEDRLALRGQVAEAETNAAAAKIAAVEHQKKHDEARARQRAGRNANVAGSGTQHVPSGQPPEQAAELSGGDSDASVASGTAGAVDPQPDGQEADSGDGSGGSEAAPEEKISEAAYQTLMKYKKESFKHGMTDERWLDILAKRGVKNSKSLTASQAKDIIGKLAHQLEMMDWHDALYGEG